MILNFLNNFENSGGEYVSWKNNHEIDIVLSGKSDLDIYVPLRDQSLLIKMAQEQNWIMVKNPVADYPHVYHFYGIDKRLQVFHLHVYFKIITGESWLKEYVFPVEKFLFNNKIKHSSGIQILNAKAQAYLFVLRHFVKNVSFSSRLLYQKELSSYQEEWELCRDGFDPQANLDLIDFSGFMKESGLTIPMTLPAKKTAKQVRKQLKKYLRLPSSRLFWYRYHSFQTRVLNKLWYKEKKILPRKGFILAFSGADGVGKSTMSDTIGETYKSFLTVKNVMLGRPQSVLVEKLRKVMNKPQKESSLVPSPRQTKKAVSLKKAISAVYLARLRYKTAKKAEKYREKGYLVISDRWPTLEHGKMDGPKLEKNTLKGIKRKCAIWENNYYQRLNAADLCLILTVPVEVAIERNRNRIKEGKETDDEIKHRHLENAHHQPKAKKTIQFDNNGALEEKRKELITIIQQHLFQHEI